MIKDARWVLISIIGLISHRFLPRIRERSLFITWVCVEDLQWKYLLFSLRSKCKCIFLVFVPYQVSLQFIVTAVVKSMSLCYNIYFYWHVGGGAYKGFWWNIMEVMFLLMTLKILAHLILNNEWSLMVRMSIILFLSYSHVINVECRELGSLK